MSSPEGAGTYTLGTLMRQVGRCLNGDHRRLLIGGQACGCTWRPEPEPEAPTGTAAILTDDGWHAIGTVTDIEEPILGGYTFTITRYPV